MASAFYLAGFEVVDICMNDFINDHNLTLDSFNGIAFVGGFSYSDVFGAAKGWYTVIKSHLRINKIFDDFYQRPDTFSLGVCNGCQLMSLLGWIPKCKLEKNTSGRFESRFSTVRINKTSSIMLNGMDESVLGVWTAHGEGKFVLDKNENYNYNSCSIQYVDHKSNPTLSYPDNPNGSEFGIAALCSGNGRHLAMMPHPERCFLNWQWPVHSELVPNMGEDEKPPGRHRG